MLQKLLIALAQVRTGFTSENLLNEIRHSYKSYIFCIKGKKLLKSIEQYNELNNIKQNGYYIYEF